MPGSGTVDLAPINSQRGIVFGLLLQIYNNWITDQRQFMSDTKTFGYLYILEVSDIDLPLISDPVIVDL